MQCMHEGCDANATRARTIKVDGAPFTGPVCKRHLMTREVRPRASVVADAVRPKQGDAEQRERLRAALEEKIRAKVGEVMSKKIKIDII